MRYLDRFDNLIPIHIDNQPIVFENEEVTSRHEYIIRRRYVAQVIEHMDGTIEFHENKIDTFKDTSTDYLIIKRCFKSMGSSIVIHWDYCMFGNFNLTVLLIENDKMLILYDTVKGVDNLKDIEFKNLVDKKIEEFRKEYFDNLNKSLPSVEEYDTIKELPIRNFMTLKSNNPIVLTAIDKENDYFMVKHFGKYLYLVWSNKEFIKDKFSCIVCLYIVDKFTIKTIKRMIFTDIPSTDTLTEVLEKFMSELMK